MSTVFIVTGAALGIGAVVVEKLIQQQHNVIGIDLNPELQSWEVLKKLDSDQTARFHAISHDISKTTTAMTMEAPRHYRLGQCSRDFRNGQFTGYLRSTMAT